MIDTLTQRVADFVIGLEPSTIPDDVTHQARRILADTVGLMVAAVNEPAVAAAVSAFPPDGGPSTLWGRGIGTRVQEAAFTNAVSAHSLELDDSHSQSLTHPASVLVPTALSVAQAHESSVDGSTILPALIAGYEVLTRLSRAMGPLRQFDRGFHPLSVAGSVGAAAVAGRVAHLDREAMCRTLALAGSQSSGVLTFRSDRSQQHKAFHVGTAARNGVYAAWLARSGYGAASDVFGDEYNMLTPFGGPDVEPALLVDGLGSEWAIMQTSIKRHPSCGRSHAPLDALFALLEEHPADPAHMDRIEIEVAHSVVASIDDRPQLTHNMQHLAAVAVLNTAAGTAALTRENLAAPWAERPDIRILHDKVDLKGADDLEAIFPGRRGARVTLVANGKTRTHETLGPLGSPDRPLSDRQLRTKLLGQVAPLYGLDVAAKLWDDSLTVDQPGGLAVLLNDLAALRV